MNTGNSRYSIFTANLNKFVESKCFFLGNFVLILILVLVHVLVMNLPLNTSAEILGSTSGHG